MVIFLFLRCGTALDSTQGLSVHSEEGVERCLTRRAVVGSSHGHVRFGHKRRCSITHGARSRRGKAKQRICAIGIKRGKVIVK